VAALTGADVNARQVIVTAGMHLVGRADNPVALAEDLAEFFKAIARTHRAGRVEPLRKRPSSDHFQAVAIALEAGKEPGQP
jgi:hypothetical protein